ncbi:hypothetical protein [Mycoplasma sp. Ms02]|uniref:hypothetical protein n=1 Tax=Mycoplasma sp. Ms02 TaxID=353851 RepID=UPI001C8AC6D1|nr:hypothetical protein [Mycoplasma sp. Ms02]QZE12526.1 hypothetical protein K4L35_00860 [Mycoplasma sp. Ms02]
MDLNHFYLGIWAIFLCFTSYYGVFLRKLCIKFESHYWIIQRLSDKETLSKISYQTKKDAYHVMDCNSRFIFLPFLIGILVSLFQEVFLVLTILFFGFDSNYADILLLVIFGTIFLFYFRDTLRTGRVFALYKKEVKKIKTSLSENFEIKQDKHRLKYYFKCSNSQIHKDLIANQINTIKLNQ